MRLRAFARAGRDSLQEIARAGLSGARRSTSAFRALPDFVIIGAQKAGTTSLFRYLEGHPDFLPSYKKEVHFFDVNFSHGVGWYKAHFPLASYKRKLEAQRGRAVLTGEATPYYLFHPCVPERMAALVPGAKLIVLLRNPIERAYSHYQHQVRKGRETHDFQEALRLEPGILKAELERLDRDPLYPSYDHATYSYLARGLYADQLERWFTHYDRDRILILNSEEFFQEPQRSFDNVLRFLGLPALELQGLRTYNAGRYNDSIDSKLRSELAEYFMPHNQRLFSLLGRTYDWR